MTPESLANALVIGGALVAGAVLFNPRLQRAGAWRATVTPLASIIGSGFLVLAPLLVREFGSRAVLAMAVLCGVAYAVGGAIRFNIVALDRFGEAGLPAGAGRVDRLSSWALVFAYVVSVAYYLNLFGAFSLDLTPWHSQASARVVTTVVLCLIAAIGWGRGLRGMERAESLTVSFKLAVIMGLVLGLALYAWHASAGAGGPPPAMEWGDVRLMFGLVITVQGFETSRYLSQAHDAPTRVRTMRWAQWISTAIYLAYIGLAGQVIDAGSVELHETEVIDMMRPVAGVLPFLLVAVALAAQFSAAVADTNGAGGLAAEMSRERIRPRVGYVGLVVLAIALTWTTNLFGIINYASRAFAGYYMLQCGLACHLAWRGGLRAQAAWFGALSLLMLSAMALGLPAE